MSRHFIQPHRLPSYALIATKYLRIKEAWLYTSRFYTQNRRLHLHALIATKSSLEKTVPRDIPKLSTHLKQLPLLLPLPTNNVTKRWWLKATERWPGHTYRHSPLIFRIIRFDMTTNIIFMHFWVWFNVISKHVWDEIMLDFSGNQFYTDLLGVRRLEYFIFCNYVTLLQV